jgi:hypothetical protein
VVSDRLATIRRLPDRAAGVDLRRAQLSEVQAIDFRAPGRDFWADEAALWDRFTAVWAGLDDAAWRLAGAAPSDAGGPEWSLHEHVAHVADWLELAADYVSHARDTGRWPTDDDYDGGDFDTWNERRRERYRAISPTDLQRRLYDERRRVLAVAGEVPLATIRGDAAWGWVYNVLHGHSIDHLRVLEPWADQLRTRQAGNDPFGPDPQPRAATLDADLERFWRDEAAIHGSWQALIGNVPEHAWTAGDVTPGWSLADHVGHLASWFDQAVGVLEEHRRTGRWTELPAEGIDAWNHVDVGLRRGTSVRELRALFEDGRARLLDAARAMTPEEWLDPEGFSWAYEDLHGHLRQHLAMVGPYVARARWTD